MKRVLNDDEKPLELGLTLSSQEPDEWKSFLHFKIARKDLLTVKIFRRNSSEPLAFIINENSNIQKLIELIASKFPVEDIKKTFIQEQFGNEKPQIIDNQKKIIDIIKGWGDKCENYKFLYKDSNLQIKGMEDFFYKYESQKIEDVSFDEINRNIMDIVVEGNSFYLKNEGFVDDTKGNSEFIHDNLSLLDRIKKEMDDEDSQFSKYLQRSKQMIDNKIDAYLEIAVPKVAKILELKDVMR
ncbi:hypothetical protein M0811_08441 [Anaeramoeba ignava]|uniref:Ras-associating domain-containing protein n=1 Tax=Anaeramoeba ignava TaxID=1746090 RepID=A0A9Q0RCD0_ANAIG|nr:hypothetical protein M0811_08441 [Anaeramoeba ignava]